MTAVALLGDREPGFVTHRALDALVRLVAPAVRLEWVATDTADAGRLAAMDGVWAVPGTPYRDGDVVLEVLRRRRESGAPTFGTCGGFQHMVVEFARGVAGLAGAAHGETDPGAADVVVSGLACSLVGEVREVTAVPGTTVARTCGTTPFPGFHYCGYGVDPGHLATLQAAGLVVSATAPDAGVEAVELPAHPFWVGTLFQPQMSALDGEVHPLVAAFLRAASR